MLVLHRITPFLIGLVLASGFLGLMRLPAAYSFIVAGAVALLLAVLFARLAGFEPRKFRFWYFVGTPVLFFLSAFGLFLFLEQGSFKIALALIVSLMSFLFAEHLFNYVHLPAKYQAYSLEHVSLVLYVLTTFFAATVGFGTAMVIQAPLWLLAPLFFLVMLYVVYGMLWVSKVDPRKARAYAFGGAVITTELFTVLSFLPTGFYANAAALAVCVYVFLGISRAHFLDKLSRVVLRRYAFMGVLLLGVIAGTARWL
jgi:hypothetical protein